MIILLSCTERIKPPLDYSIKAKNAEVRRSSHLVDSLMSKNNFQSADSIYDKLANEYSDSSDIYFIRLRQIDTKIFTHRWDEAKKLVNFCFVQNKVPELPVRGPIYYHQYMATIDRNEGNRCSSMEQLDSLVDYSILQKQIIDTQMVILNYQLIIDDKHIDSALIATQSLSSIANLVRQKTGCP